MKRISLIFSLMLLLIFVACEGNQPKLVTSDDKSADNSSQVKPASQPVSSGQPAQGGAPAAGAVEKPAELVELEKAFEKSPNDENKKKLAQATYEFGKKLNYDPALPPKVKYPQALRMFRRAIELDPANLQAAAEKKQIEDIYTSMNRPIPE